MENDCLYAVLTPRQLAKLCRLFGLQPSDLRANFDGWCKHVLMSKDLVFLFPRSPEFADVVKRELAFYEQFSHLSLVALPRFVRRVKDREISYYEFGAVTRLPGTPFSRFIDAVSLSRLEELLVDLAETITVWHSIPRNAVPGLLSDPPKPLPRRITVDNWHKKVLSPATTEEAVDFIYRFILRISRKKRLPDAIAQETDAKARWTGAIRELAGLSHVLVHGDVHEDHILVEPPNLKITGIVDWQTARIDNPIWDFNFGEWDWPIFKWQDHYIRLRRKMWQRYLEVRQISVSTLDGLHLFYVLWDMIWLVFKRRNDEDKTIPTGVGFEDSVGIYLDRLNEVTALLPA